MKTFLIACTTAIVIAIVGGIVLNSTVQERVDDAYSSPTSVRLGA